MAIEDAPVVKVFDFDEDEAYNPDRPISGLIRTQLLHLHHAENLIVPAQFRSNININNLLTERHASDYIHRVTQLLHRYGESDNARKPAPKRKTTSKRASKSVKKTQIPAKKASKSTKKEQNSAQKPGRKQGKKTIRNKSKSR